MSDVKPTMTIKQIGDALFTCVNEPMSVEATKAMLLLLRLEQVGEPVPQEMVDSFGFQVIKKRIEWFSEFRKSMEFDKSEKPITTDHLIAMFSFLSDRVGACVLYAAAIAAMYMNKQDTVTMQIAFTEFFPDGIPTDDGLGKVWASQKIGGANSVDTAEAWYWDLDIPIYHADTADQAIDMLKNLTEKK